MKKIIAGKRYDTDTAKARGTWTNGVGRRDFSWCEETLYQKQTGEFFIYGEGGPMTRYAERVDSSSWCGGENITPLSYDQAREWAEEHLTADEYEEIFEILPDDNSRTTITLTIPTALAGKLKLAAGKTGKTQSDIVAELLASIS